MELIKIPCPVCIIDGALIFSCRFFGVPDPVTSFLLGIFTMTLAIVTLRYLRDKLRLTDVPKGALIFILVVYSVITLATMRLIGFF